MYDLIRCLLALLGNGYLALGIVAIGLVGTGGREFSKVAFDLWLYSLLLGFLIAAIPRPRLLPVVISAFIIPAYVQILLIQGLLESENTRIDLLWITLPAAVSILSLAPLLIRISLVNLRAEPGDAGNGGNAPEEGRSP